METKKLTTKSWKRSQNEDKLDAQAGRKPEKIEINDNAQPAATKVHTQSFATAKNNCFKQIHSSLHMQSKMFAAFAKTIRR
jgi:hypothetical protein